MTQREKELYEIIRANPSISQNEIAEKMNISRSAVSVYLNELYKKKILLGRGYILNGNKRPVVIGPAHVDIRSITDSSSINHSSSGMFKASKIQVNYGGAAKNVIDYLFNFGQPTHAILALGNDEFGSAYISFCAKQGISPSDFIIIPNASTSLYNELIDENRNCILSYVSDFEEMNLITPMDMQNHTDILDTSSMFILHDSLPLAVIEYLHSAYSELPFFLIGSNKVNCTLLQDAFGYFCSSILSMEIAVYLAWNKTIPDVSLDILPDICRRLVKMGLTNFYIMADSQTMVHCDKETLTIHTSHNSSYSRNCRFPHYYSDCRDILVAIICYDILNGSGKIPVLDYLAAARNLANSKDFYFERNIPLSLLAETAQKLGSKVITRPLNPGSPSPAQK